jgi:hypothetical protein
MKPFPKGNPRGHDQTLQHPTPNAQRPTLNSSDDRHAQRLRGSWALDLWCRMYCLCLFPGLALPALAATNRCEIGRPSIVAEVEGLGGSQVAFGSDCYLVVWQAGWAGVNPTANILGRRLKSGTLEPLDATPLAICDAPEAQEAPAVAYGDGMFLVAWQDLRNGRDLDIRAALIDAKSGKRKGDELALAVKPGNEACPSVAACAGKFLVTWQEIVGRDRYRIVTMRLDAGGKLLDPAPLEVSPLGCRPVACASGDRFLVTWDTDSQTQTAAALIDAATGKLTLASGKKPDGRINTACGSATAAAGDGHGNFMTASARASVPNPWGWTGPGAVLCARVNADGQAPDASYDYGYYLANVCGRKVPNVVDTATWGKSDRWLAGSKGGFKGTADGWWPNGAPAVACDGCGGYLFAWIKGRIAPDILNLSEYRLWLRGMDGASLAVTLPDVPVEAPDAAVNETQPRLVAGPTGELLLLCNALKPGETPRILARALRLRD